jgi:hypothetical protein
MTSEVAINADQEFSGEAREIERLKARVQELEEAARNLLEHDGYSGSKDWDALKFVNARHAFIVALTGKKGGRDETEHL